MCHQNDAPNECARVIYHPRCAQNAFGSTQTPAALNHSRRTRAVSNHTRALFSHVMKIKKWGIICYLQRELIRENYARSRFCLKNDIQNNILHSSKESFVLVFNFIIGWKSSTDQKIRALYVYHQMWVLKMSLLLRTAKNKSSKQEIKSNVMWAYYISRPFAGKLYSSLLRVLYRFGMCSAPKVAAVREARPQARNDAYRNSIKSSRQIIPI